MAQEKLKERAVLLVMGQAKYHMEEVNSLSPSLSLSLTLEYNSRVTQVLSFFSLTPHFFPSALDFACRSLSHVSWFRRAGV
jgi:hypothetical protein